MLGGMYALIAMGLTLQYGVARIMNLSYGEFLIAAAFAAHWLFTGWAVSPFVGLVLVVPAAFVLNFAIYKILLTPLVRRAPNRDALEVDLLAETGQRLTLAELERAEKSRASPAREQEEHDDRHHDRDARHERGQSPHRS